MKKCILFSFPGNTALTAALAEELKLETGSIELRDFPDGESYLRVDSDVKDRIAILVCALDHPNNKILPLMFLAKTIRELGAKQICLIAPYLPYLRQDKCFKPGEALTSAIFARYLSGWVDSLITVDPHLHRIHALSEIYTIQNLATLHLNMKIAEWITKNIASPYIIGPDEESSQWVSEVAKMVNAPYAIVKKIRYGDRKIEISVPNIKAADKTPVLVDDIVSTGTTMLAALQQLSLKCFKKSVCVVVHALFNKQTYENLLAAGAEKIVSCNTIPHFSNAIDASELIAQELAKFLSL